MYATRVNSRTWSRTSDFQRSSQPHLVQKQGFRNRTIYDVSTILTYGALSYHSKTSLECQVFIYMNGVKIKFVLANALRCLWCAGSETMGLQGTLIELTSSQLLILPSSHPPPFNIISDSPIPTTSIFTLPLFSLQPFFFLFIIISS
jgi:hypothetical protein